jgi:microcystin-dependent protein
MSDPYIGEIRMFGGNFAPVGWEACNGQLLPISEYDTLFNLIGTTYGGDGQNTFAVPNLQSRIPVHAPNPSQLGVFGGLEAVTLVSNQLPVHTHQASGSNVFGGQASPSGHVWSQSSYSQYSTSAPASTPMSAAALQPAGGNEPHENMPPFLAVTFIISLFGIYPSPS